MRRVLLVLLPVAAAAVTAGPAAAVAGPGNAGPSTVRVSVSTSGGQSDDGGQLGGESDVLKEAMTTDGRYVGFTSAAANLVPGDTDNTTDAFVRDTVDGITTRVNVSSRGVQDNSRSGVTSLSINADGREAAFDSPATNLVAKAVRGVNDIFLHYLRTRRTVLVSVSSAGHPANAGSGDPVISGNGRYVAFSSFASNLIDGRTIENQQVYVRDLATGTTSLVSASTAGAPAADSPFAATLPESMSLNGRFIAFSTSANNLVSHDTNEADDVFVRDMATGTTRRVSISSTGAQADLDSVGGSLSGDGTKIAFSSGAANLVRGDHNGGGDVFLRDLTTGKTRLVSRSTDGAQGNDSSAGGVLSTDGRHVAFASFASNLVPGDRNGAVDVFVRDLGRHVTERVDVSKSGAEAALGCTPWHVSISAHGRRVAFDSEDATLVAGDTNSTEDVFERDRG